MYIDRYRFAHEYRKITLPSIACGMGTENIILAGSMQLFTKNGDLQTDENSIFLHDHT